jgi:hypothetical protein
MARSKSRSPETAASVVAADPAAERVDDAALIASVADARQAGEEDSAGVEELLQRAADANRAALDRLAR